MPAARACATDQLETDAPRTRISPASGRWIPEMILMSVDLPAPLSPMSPMISQPPTRRLTCSRAETLLYDLETSRSSTTLVSMGRRLAQTLDGHVRYRR